MKLGSKSTGASKYSLFALLSYGIGRTLVSIVEHKPKFGNIVSENSIFLLDYLSLSIEDIGKF